MSLRSATMQKNELDCSEPGIQKPIAPGGQKISIARVGRSLQVVGCKRFSTVEIGTGRVGSNQPRQQCQWGAVRTAPIASAHSANLII